MGHLMCAACFTHLLADGRYEIKNWRKLNTLKNYLEWFDQTLWTISVNESSWLLTISFSLFPFFPLAVCSLRDQIATCPNCRVEISKSTASRNLAVEKAASELPSECQVSGEVKAPWPQGKLILMFAISSVVLQQGVSLQIAGASWTTRVPGTTNKVQISSHWLPVAWTLSWQWVKENDCFESISIFYLCLLYQYPPLSIYIFLFPAANEHERNCLHPQKSGYEVMAALEAHDVKIKEEKKMFNTLIDLLSYEKIIFNGQ